MAVIRNLVVKIAADISSLSKGLQTAEKQIKKVASAFTAAGSANSPSRNGDAIHRKATKCMLIFMRRLWERCLFMELLRREFRR